MLWWLSFGDPETGKNQGVCVVEAVNERHAVLEGCELAGNLGVTSVLVEQMDTPRRCAEAKELGIGRWHTPAEMVARGYTGEMVRAGGNRTPKRLGLGGF